MIRTELFYLKGELFDYMDGGRGEVIGQSLKEYDVHLHKAHQMVQKGRISRKLMSKIKIHRKDRLAIGTTIFSQIFLLVNYIN